MILNPFRKPSPLRLATQELEDAQREHLAPEPFPITVGSDRFSAE